MKSSWHSIMSVGAYVGETDIDRGKRRIVVGYLFFGVLTRLIFLVGEFGAGSPEAWVDVCAAATSIVLLCVLGLRPHWFVGVVNVALLAILIEVLAATLIDGGIIPSDLLILFGLLTVIGALIALTTRAALWWLLAYGVTVGLAVFLPNWIEPLNEVAGSVGGVVLSIVGVTVFLFAGMSYFVRQRDQFQSQSDDLLHNILPDEIATRLKTDHSMIADDYESASVLFADVVDFTPMSARLSPTQLVGLLNSVFTDFDAFVDDLGLEKIKTVGDAYMVAAGVPAPRSDHAHAIAELALRIRDHTASKRFDGHAISMRIGINSGPVVAGIVGTDKFAYDLWGDVVNTASRMESSGIPGAIQVTEETYLLIRDGFVCEPRGVVTVKGKGEMSTYLLISGGRQNA